MLITDKPDDLPSTNELDKIPDDILDAPPAYYSLGSTPQPMTNPPSVGDKGTLLVRWECTGEGRTVRTDGELRHTRKLTVLWAVPEGSPKPLDPAAPQPALFDDDGNPSDDSEPDDQDDDVEDNVARPDFSDRSEK